MSKQALQKAAFDHSGVSHKESLVAQEGLEPPLLERIGGEDGFEELTNLFYTRVFQDKGHMDEFLGIFASSSQNEATENLCRFLIQTFGGRRLYQEKKGKYVRLVGRHANYGITHVAAKRWLHHMRLAVAEHSRLQQDTDASTALMKYFTYTAHYIVVAKEYMRSDQLSGGTQIDSGRIW